MIIVTFYLFTMAYATFLSQLLCKINTIFSVLVQQQICLMIIC